MGEISNEDLLVEGWGDLPAIWRWNMIDPWLSTVKAGCFFVI